MPGRDRDAALIAGGWRFVADGVAVRTSRRELTLSTLLVSGSAGVLIDPAWDPDELAGIARSVSAARVVLAAGLATHAHHDHLLWHPDLPPVPRYASAATVATAHDHRAELVAALGEFPAELADLMGRVTVLAAERIPWPGPTAELVVHDAHTPGHTAVWLPDDRVLIAGDMLSDVEIPLPEDTGLAEYDAGLRVLRPYAERAAVVIPGHGRPGTDARARWLADRHYLDAVTSGRDPQDPRST